MSHRGGRSPVQKLWRNNDLKKKKKDSVSLFSDRPLYPVKQFSSAVISELLSSSTEALPSISSVRRDEVDDMYVLPALPPQEEREKNR